ncbi:Protein PRK-2 [Aphelenchoides avenae]|nr:Protein PRK-2 [Aphelenchus avenae]
MRKSSGGFGTVYRAVRLCDRLPVAVKFIERENVTEWEKVEHVNVPLELSMLARCRKIDGVIQLMDWYSVPEGYIIVMERPSPCIDLHDFINSQRLLSEDIARFLFPQVVKAIAACAERQVLYRDIKDKNIVLNLETGTTKLCDFGAATLLKKTRYHDFQGTRLYSPPEWFLLGLELGLETASWSLGVLLYRMTTGRLPFLNKEEICDVTSVEKLRYRQEPSPELRDLITKCFSFDPCHRPDLDDLLSHAWTVKPTPDWQTLMNLMEVIPEDMRKLSTPTDGNAKDFFTHAKTVPDVIYEEPTIDKLRTSVLSVL